MFKWKKLGKIFDPTEIKGKKWMQEFAAFFPLKWLTQGMRSVFLPDSFAVKEVAASWEVSRILIALLIWLVVGTALALKTFRWSDR